MRGPYDVDVVVIGAGPAGLAAALRLRWVKGYEALPVSVRLVDPEEPGGLGALGGCVLTGPSWATGAQGLLGPLRADLHALAIPHTRQRAISLDRRGPLLEVGLEGGGALSCHAVVLATGFRALHGEARWFGRGVWVTYKGYGFFPSLFAEVAQRARGRGMAVIGHEATLDLLPWLSPLAHTAGGVHLVLQGPPRSLDLPPGVTVRWGAARGYRGDDQLEGVEIAGQEELRCGAVLVDYHAFERRPEWGLRGGALPGRDERGFVRVDPLMATDQAGVFAAGDVTGRFASTLMALGDGTCAALSAWRWVQQRKLGRMMPLFAYSADPPPDPAATPLELPPEAVLVPLGEPALIEDALKLPPTLSSRLAHDLTVSAVHHHSDGSSDLNAELLRLMHLRVLTLHHIHARGGT